MEKEQPKSRFREYFKDILEGLPLKIVIVTFSGGAVSVFPFFVLSMQQLGLTIHEIATMFLFVPIASLLGPVVSGLIADKLGNYNRVFICNVILGVLCYNVYLIIPGIPRSTVSVTCADDSVNVLFDNCTNCAPNPELLFTGETVLLERCKPCLPDATMREDCIENISSKLCPIVNERLEILLHFPTTSFSSCVAEFPNYNNVNTTLVNYIEEDDANCTKIDSVCDLKCEVSAAVSDKMCNDDSSLVTRTFMLLMTFTFLGHFFLASCFTMMDATILQFAREHNANLGKQKIMSIIGFGTAPIIAGALVDFHSNKIGHESYFAAFMLSDALMAVACITTYFVNIKVDMNESNILIDLGKLITRLEVNLFLLVALILGCNFGFIESYLFIYLRSLNASTFLLGLTMTVGCFASIPMLFWADHVEKKIGRHLIFLICFTAYAIRMFGYSFIQNPWTCLFFELFEVITYQLMWVTVLRLCPLLAGKGLLATMTGMTGAVHYSFGKGIGGFIGGKLIAAVGMRKSFRIFGGLSLCGGIFYIIIHYAYLNKKIQEREKLLKMEEEEKAREQENNTYLLNHDTNRTSTGDTELHDSIVSVTGPRRVSLIEGVALIESLDDHKTKHSNNLYPLLSDVEKNLANDVHLEDGEVDNSVDKLDLKSNSIE